MEKRNARILVKPIKDYPDKELDRIVRVDSEPFEVSEERGKMLIEKGLVERVNNRKSALDEVV